MASHTAFDALKTFITDGWTATRLYFENRRIDLVDQTPLIKVSMTSQSFIQESIGADVIRDNRWVETGTTTFEILVRAGTGSETARLHAEAITDMFRGTLPESFVLIETSVGMGQQGVEDGNWWALKAHVDWEFG